MRVSMGIIPSQVEDHEGTLVAGFSNRLGAETVRFSLSGLH